MPLLLDLAHILDVLFAVDGALHKLNVLLEFMEVSLGCLDQIVQGKELEDVVHFLNLWLIH